VLVTGANGFVGARLCSELARQGHQVRAAVRDSARVVDLSGEVVVTGALGTATDWSAALEGVDAVVHLAARVHVLRDTAADPVAEYRVVNVEATQGLARAAAARGVKRLVFASSIKVNGEATGDRPFRHDDVPAPADPYGVSKWEAECALHRISHETGLEVVVVRPPLVYGPGVGGNFRRLLKLVVRGMPLPFGAVDNRRSMIYNGNLANALAACSFHPDAAGKTYLVSDGEDLSTADLVRRLAAALGVTARLLPVPPQILRLAGALTGRTAEIDRLTGSLRVDSAPIRTELGWGAAYSMQEGLADTAGWFAALRP